ncbi:hypothetical protein FSP39_009192 [Pinctada imbricata]|uniref:Uncharacterized protein n=1 Tax=Pinctada imbricata TaxID=66713 RepID=A0AA89BN86_PINIB|nr:hypothetical protein FSP39_009192 [Pinctada imbricata]
MNDYNRECKIPSPAIDCDTDYKYRTIDGTCNNLKHPQWGSASTAQARFLEAHYDNGYDSPRNTGTHGAKLPSARVISNILHRSTEKTDFDPHLTVMHMSYGQYLDHDLIATPIVMGINNSDLQCCGVDEIGPECIPIDIPTDDPYYNRSCMSLTRSSPAPRVDRVPGAREQLNEVTSYIDASTVYGSDDEIAASLRTFKKGLLITESHERLPSGGKSKCFLETEADYCQKAGDKRVNVVPNLGALHLLFVREHNRIAERLAAINPSWNDETIYQESRKIVSAITQHITYNEYLPEILGQRHMEMYGLYSNTSGFHRIYDEKLDASVRNVVGAAAFRFGHSQVPNHQAVFDKYRRPTMVKPIEQTYHRPHMCAMWNGRGADGLMRWLTTAHSTASDRFFESGVRDKLFQDKDKISMDLPAVNIQRGRDHGLPGYNKWREWCNLPVAKTFSQLRDHDRHTTKLLSQLYRFTYLIDRHPDDIDLFAGAMAETTIPDSLVGPTFACILSMQFQALKRGDRFWYENPFRKTGFNQDEVVRLTAKTYDSISGVRIL